MTSEPNDMPAVPIGLDDIVQAAQRLEPWVHRTPVLTSRTLDERSGCRRLPQVREPPARRCLQVPRSDERAPAARRDQKAAGVVTHSSGNHAQALALAGQLLGVPVTIVMPRTAPAVKRAATEGYGARIVLCEPTLESRESTVAAEIERHGFTLVHPFNDWNVIAGQGTAALELLEQAGPLDVVIAPVGGGGLLSGTALAVKGRSPGTEVIGAEPANADDARRSLETGAIQPSLDPRTIADGLRTSLGTRTFAVIRGTSTRSSRPPRPRSSTRPGSSGNGSRSSSSPRAPWWWRRCWPAGSTARPRSASSSAAATSTSSRSSRSWRRNGCECDHHGRDRPVPGRFDEPRQPGEPDS